MDCTFGYAKLLRNYANRFPRLHDILSNLDSSLFDVIVHTLALPNMDVSSVK
jgi:hypothetical protein